MRPRYTSTFILIIVSALLVCVHATDAGDLPSLKIENAWVRAMPPGAGNTAAYMILINNGDTPLRLTGGSTPIAKSVSPMVTTKKQVSGTDVLGMADVDALVIPAHGRCEMKPGGDHLMIMDLTAHPQPGSSVKLTLRIDPGGKEITLDVPVR